MLNTTEEVGKYFGYPACCIKAYEDIENSAGRMTAEQAFISATMGGGFIPCPAHAKEVLEGKVALSALITNRICPLPFPQEPDIQVIDEYLAVVA